MRVEYSGEVVKLFFTPVPEINQTLLEVYEESTITLDKMIFSHDWAFLMSELRDEEDKMLGTREQVYMGRQTFMRDSLKEVSMRPYVETEAGKDDYADGKWGITMIFTTGASWRILLEDREEAIAMNNVLVDYMAWECLDGIGEKHQTID